MFQAAILCSDHKPDIRSFLLPLIKEFKKFGQGPMLVKKNGEELCRAHMYLMGVTSDLIESQKLLDFGGKYIYGKTWQCYL